MEKVDAKGYQYFVQRPDGGGELILDILNAEGVLPGEVLRLLIKQPRVGLLNTDIDYLITRRDPDSYTLDKHHQ